MFAKKILSINLLFIIIFIQSSIAMELNNEERQEEIINWQSDNTLDYLDLDQLYPYELDMLIAEINQLDEVDPDKLDLAMIQVANLIDKLTKASLYRRHFALKEHLDEVRLNIAQREIESTEAYLQYTRKIEHLKCERDKVQYRLEQAQKNIFNFRYENYSSIINTTTESLDKYIDRKDANLFPSGKNQIIIFIWEPHEDCVGHSSMLIAPLSPHPQYISAWPDDFHRTYIEDVESERGLPHHMFTLFTDDYGMDNLIQEWIRIKRNGIYNFNSSFMTKIRTVNQENKFNCVSLVEHLLEIAKPEDPKAYRWPAHHRARSLVNMFQIAAGISAGIAGYYMDSPRLRQAGWVLGISAISMITSPYAPFNNSTTYSDLIIQTPSKQASWLLKEIPNHLHVFKLKKFEASKIFDTRSPKDYFAAESSKDATEIINAKKKAAQNTIKDKINDYFEDN